MKEFNEVTRPDLVGQEPDRKPQQGKPEELVDNLSSLTNAIVGINRTPNVAYDGYAEVVNNLFYGNHYKSTTVRLPNYDTDLDGMADAWVFGDLSQSYNDDHDNDGYTNIEDISLAYCTWQPNWRRRNLLAAGTRPSQSSALTIITPRRIAAAI